VRNHRIGRDYPLDEQQHHRVMMRRMKSIRLDDDRLRWRQPPGVQMKNRLLKITE
jgi:hypothetical protein